MTPQVSFKQRVAVAPKYFASRGPSTSVFTFAGDTDLGLWLRSTSESPRPPFPPDTKVVVPEPSQGGCRCVFSHCRAPLCFTAVSSVYEKRSRSFSQARRWGSSER